MTALTDAPPLPMVAHRRHFPTQKVVGYAVAITAALCVLYPIYYLIQASLDVGDPNVRPPTAYGLDNYALLPNTGR